VIKVFNVSYLIPARTFFKQKLKLNKIKAVKMSS